MRLISFLLAFTLSVYAQEYAVISNSILDDLSPLQLKAIFLKKLTHINNKHIVPVNLPSSSKIRESFERELLHMSKKRLKSYWIKKHYLGVRPPVTMKSQKSALAFVKNVQGAITYVKIENIDKSVKILYRFSDGESE